MLRPIRTHFFLTAFFVSSCIVRAIAQDETDALRYSTVQPQGTARAIGIGNALGSVGGDFGCLSVNPAGIGIYRSSEIMFTSSLIFGKTTSDYTGSSSEASGSHFSISNAGIISTNIPSGPKRGGWTSVTFGFGMNRMADFTRDYYYQGRNETSSGSFVFEADANSYGVSSTGQITSPADLGYQSWLLDTVTGGYLSVVNPTPQNPVGQSVSVRERGSISEMVLSLGGSHQEKLMLGATVGIPIIRFIRDKTFYEADLSGNPNNDFDDFTYFENLRTTGAGVNLKVGVIYKVSDEFRFGAAIHTPTYLGLKDYFNSAVTANTEQFHGTETAVALENQFDYSLTTPWRGIASGTLLLGGKGFVTADYEYVNYASAHFNFSNTGDHSYENYINGQIDSLYRSASNIRAGVEIRLDPFLIRGGFGYYGSAYRNNSAFNRQDYSIGFGWRYERLFLDFAYLYRHYENSEQPYVLPDTNVPNTLYYNIVVPTAQMSSNASLFALTIGLKLN